MRAKPVKLAEESLPPPSAELVLIRVFVEAYLATAHEKPRRRARAFLDASASILQNEETVALVTPIRPAAEHAKVTEARKQAAEMFRRLRPIFLAKLPPD